MFTDGRGPWPAHCASGAGEQGAPHDAREEWRAQNRARLASKQQAEQDVRQQMREQAARVLLDRAQVGGGWLKGVGCAGVRKEHEFRLCLRAMMRCIVQRAGLVCAVHQ